MIFSSYQFVFLFFPSIFVVWMFASVLKDDARVMYWRKIILVFGSFIFYGIWKIEYIPLLLSSIIFNFYIAKIIFNTLNSNKRCRFFFSVGVLVNLSTLGFYKYVNFFIENINAMSSASLFFHHIALPLGISFFTFQQIAYLSDTYNRKACANSFVDYTLFVSFFPQLIAGPIVHHSEMMPQFSKTTTKDIHWKNIALGFTIFTIGLSKKIILADTFSSWVGPVFDSTSDLLFFEAWGAALAYTFQIYFDFSGYCDMAIGLGLFFNIKLPVNFYSPYKSINIAEFWRRWHITLGRWFRNYLYIPLGGSKISPIRTVCSLLSVMFFAGLWHGAAWTFVAWGGAHGIALSIHSIWKKMGLRLHRFAGCTITFFFVVIAWVPFRATSFQDTIRLFKGMFILSEGSIALPINIFNVLLNFFTSVSFSPVADIIVPSNASMNMTQLCFILIGCVIVFIFPNSIDIIGFANQSDKCAKKFNPKSLFNAIVVGILFSLAATWMMASTGSEFIYFNF